MVAAGDVRAAARQLLTRLWAVASHLALVLAGSGYTDDGPVLAVPMQALEQCGAAVVVIPL